MLTILSGCSKCLLHNRQAFGRSFGLQQVWQTATQGRDLIKAIAYAIDRAMKQQRQNFQNMLRAIGFE